MAVQYYCLLIYLFLVAFVEFPSCILGEFLSSLSLDFYFFFTSSLQVTFSILLLPATCFVCSLVSLPLLYLLVFT